MRLVFWRALVGRIRKNKPFTLLELVVSPTVMNGLKSMKQAMKQVTKAEMKRLSATTTDDQICFLGAIDRRRRSSGVALKDDEIIGPHRQTEDTFQYTTSQAVQVWSFLNRGNEPKSFGLLMASRMVGWRFTVSHLMLW